MSYLVLSLATMVLLGAHYFLAKLVSAHVAASVVAFVSTLTTIPVLLGYMLLAKAPMPDKIYLGYAILTGIPLAVALMTLYVALARGPVSVVMPIYGLNAFVVALLGILILHEPISAGKALGLLFAVLAIVLLTRS